MSSEIIAAFLTSSIITVLGALIVGGAMSFVYF